MPHKTTHNFIIVSNRLPVNVTKEHGKLVFKPSTGGLATAMSSVGTDQDTKKAKVWIGWPGIPSDDLTAADKRIITKELKKYQCAPVFLTRRQVEGYYDGYANATIWPVFHYFHHHAVFNQNYWELYQQVNKVFEKAVVRHADPDATIWVHDYHFMLLPRLLKKELPDSSIGFFLHIPFPSYEIFRLLPNRAELLKGLLGADLIGFHTYDYVRHFASSVLQVLGYDSEMGAITAGHRTVMADVFPIGIDYQKFVTALQEPTVKAEMQQLDERYKGQRLIISVDRLDYSKGIAERLEAFDAFLEKHPKYHKKISLMVIAVPSRTDVDTYKQLRDTIERTVSRINGKYATMEWSPISYQYKNLPFEQIVALYAAADVALVTPLRDGMNLVAKEYIASKQSRNGVLILSEMAGATHELPEAIKINPYDTPAIVHALEDALKMPAIEQKRAMHGMQGRISHYSVTRWAHDFIKQLNRAQAHAKALRRRNLDGATQQQLFNAYATAKKRLFLLDYDGTLHAYTSSHLANAARPSPALRRLLSRLAADPRNTVCIVSGRDRTTLRDWFGNLPLNLVAEHGAWIYRNRQWVKIAGSFDEYKQKLWKPLIEYVERTPGATIEEKDFSLVWHYRGVAPELAYLRNTNLRHDLKLLLADTDIGIFEGNKILEIKPRNIRKSIKAQEFITTVTPDFVLCAGDDFTDEDMFEVMPEGAWTIKVGPGATQAKYHINSVDDMVALLSRLAR
jgi:trehalose 6-phosphate synthase/phosphatase